MSQELKRQAALAALQEIRDGMVVGLGTGSTAALFIQELGRSGLKVSGIPTSEESARIARDVGIPLTDFHESAAVDVTIDGADEVSPKLDLLKGLGGALVREKIVARASKRLVIIVDETKLVDKLGTRAVIPVEVVPLAAPSILRLLPNSKLREKNGAPFVSDNGNHVVDWNHGAIDNPVSLENQIKNMTGVVDSGIFADMANCVIVASATGVRRLGK